MAYSGISDPSLPKNVARLSDVRKRQWIAAYASGKGRGLDDGEAIHLANGVIKKQMGRSMAASSDNDESLQSDLLAMVESDTEDIGEDILVEVDQHCGDYGYSSWGIVPQDEAAYQPFGFSGGQGCANCRFFRSPASCMIVAGTISPTGMSRYYEVLPEYAPPSFQLVDSNGDAVDFADLLASLSAGGMSLDAGWHDAWTPSYVDSLPDGAFAWIDPGGKRDGDGRTAPRSLRHFPYKTADGQLDEAHVRDAIVRVPTSHVNVIGKHAALVKLHGAARTLGVKLMPTPATSENVLVRGAKSAAQNIMDFLGMGTPLGEAGRITLMGHDDPDAILPTPEGRLRYWTVSSNNFFDNKGKEFPEASQHEYEQWVWEDPANRMPELQVWHTPDTRLGQADWLTFDGHFRHSTGLVDAGKEDIARTLANDPENAMSWGYFVIWDEHDRAERFRAYEESILPRKYAGNSFTSFGLQEDSVAFTEPRKDYLRKVLNLSDADIAARENRWEQFGQVLEKLNVGFHELEEYVDSERGVEPTEGQPAAATAAATPVVAAVTTVVEPAAAAAGAQDNGLATQMMTPESLATMIGSLLDSRITPLSEQINGVHAAQQAFEGRVTALIPQAKAPAQGGFDATKGTNGVPVAAQTPGGQPVVAQHDAQGTLQPLDPKVLQAIGAGIQSGETDGEQGADWVFRRLSSAHPVLNGQPTETRG